MNLGPCPHPYRTCLRRFVSLVNPLGQLGQQNFFDLFHQLPKPRLTETENAAKFSRTINELVESRGIVNDRIHVCNNQLFDADRERKRGAGGGEGQRDDDDDDDDNVLKV